jgi:hypothetical protein
LLKKTRKGKEIGKAILPLPLQNNGAKLSISGTDLTRQFSLHETLPLNTKVKAISCESMQL